MCKNAIIFNGFQRSLSVTYNTLIDYIIERYNCDIYGYIPITENERNYFESKTFNDRIIHIKVDDSYDYSKYEKFINKHKLPESVYSGYPKRNNNTYKLASMFDNISKSVNLFDIYTDINNITYDHVILTRLDLLYTDNSQHLDTIMNSKIRNEIYFSLTWKPDKKIINFAEIKPPRVGEVAHDTYYCRKKHKLFYKKGHDDLFNDQFLIGDHSSIIKLKNLYKSINKMYKDNIVIDNETMIAHFILRNNINLKGVWINNFYIKRMKRKKNYNSQY